MLFDVDSKDERKIGVYCITNTTNKKIYIGSTTTSFRHRWLQYTSAYRRGLRNQPVLFRAFEKYGFENFKFQALSICAKDECLKMEQFYIDKGTDYNSCLVAGSLLNFRHPDTAKTRTVRRGYHHAAKPVNQFLMDGSFVKKHNSIIDALMEMGKTKNGSSHISGACTGRIFSAFRYRWSFTKVPLERPNRLGKHSVTIEKGAFSKTFPSQKEASEYIKSVGFSCNQGRICRSLNKTGEKVYGFKIVKTC